MEIDRKNGSILAITLPARFEKHVNSRKKNVIFQNHFFSKMLALKYISPIVAAAAAAAAAHDHHHDRHRDHHHDHHHHDHHHDHHHHHHHHHDHQHDD